MSTSFGKKTPFTKNTSYWLLFTRKHLCWSLFLILNIDKIFQSTYFEEHLQTAASENVFMKLKKIQNHS